MSPRPDHDREKARAVGAELARRHVRVALACAAFAVGMVGMAFAAVPLYDWFCRTTGFGGTPRIAATAPASSSDRRIVIRFDANVAPGLAWSFAPEQRTLEVRVGETALVHYVAKNNWSSEAVGIASYNVSPPQAGYYFNKLECFCFKAQHLAPGERLEMPVAFYIDPEIEKDPDLRSVTTITLSYTFFPGKQVPKPLAAADGSRPPM